jgi:diguanylate cyclase (GGDEF)-like protein
VRSSLRTSSRRLFRSLASRIGFFVFAATLASALAVAGTSALAVRAFLRGKLEDRIPEAAARARERLELWFAQRALDVEIFSRSDILVDGLSRLHGGSRPRSAERGEVEQYLGYVRADLPIYSTIFVLDAAGNELARVGEALDLDAGQRLRLAGLREVDISGDLITGTGAHVQIVSAPIDSAREHAPATLHAAFPVAVLHQQLARAADEQGGRLLVFDAAGALVASSLDERAHPTLHPRIATARSGAVAEYSSFDGVRVVASALPFARLGWKIVFEGDYGSTFAPIAAILRRTVLLNLSIVLVLAGLAFAVARYLLRPLHELSAVAVRLRDGETNVRLPVESSEDEVGILTRSFGEMVDSLTRANEALEQLAITDDLTRIHNHRFFQDQLASAIRRSENTGAPLALALIDIDDFKALNDRHGHAAGDAVLAQIAQILAARARPQDVVARYGGEEFVVLAPDADLAGGIAVAETLRIAVHEQRFRIEGLADSVAVTISVGVAAFAGDRRRFFGDADRALYAAKHAGKDCVMAASEG